MRQTRRAMCSQFFINIELLRNKFRFCVIVEISLNPLLHSPCANVQKRITCDVNFAKFHRVGLCLFVCFVTRQRETIINN